MNTYLDNIISAGFSYQEPTTDKTWFFVRHSETKSELIWLKLKKTPEVEYRCNYKRQTLPEKEEILISEFVADLGYDEFTVLSPETN